MTSGYGGSGAFGDRFSSSVRRTEEQQHRCHAIRCPKPTPPSRLMCSAHWNMVPYRLQKEVWAHYRTGQEVDKNPSPEYLLAAQAAVQFVAQKEGYLA